MDEARQELAVNREQIAEAMRGQHDGLAIARQALAAARDELKAARDRGDFKAFGPDGIKFEFDKPGGRDVLEVHKLACGHNGEKLFSGLHLSISRGDKVAVIGRNGVGKTTLIETLLGTLAPMAGNIKWGHEVDVGYFPQEHEGVIPPGHKIFDWMFEQKPVAGKEGVRSVLGRMLFSGEDGDKPTATLSGGERVRGLLARLMLLRHNTLILDEPTNHMDLEAISSLRDGIQSFAGTCIFVTHDRDLIESVANRIVVLEPGRIDVYPGGWVEYRRAKQKG